MHICSRNIQENKLIDEQAVVWNSETGKLLYKLPGHKGTVNFAEMSPSTDPISKYSWPKHLWNKYLTVSVLSGSSDRTLLLGELK